MVLDILRTVRFRPYRRGMGPVFRLTTWDTNTRDSYGKYRLGYRLSIGREQNAAGNPPAWEVLFHGTDFGCSPLHAIDSDATVAGIMAFLTLRPGDTDAEYFADYSQVQLDYCSEYAEALDSEVRRRFGEN